VFVAPIAVMLYYTSNLLNYKGANTGEM
jgi:hypothetical protein